MVALAQRNLEGLSADGKLIKTRRTSSLGGDDGGSQGWVKWGCHLEKAPVEEAWGFLLKLESGHSGSDSLYDTVHFGCHSVSQSFTRSTQNGFLVLLHCAVGLCGLS